MATKRRLEAEVGRLRGGDIPANIRVELCGNTLHKWHVMIEGPPGSLYARSTFFLTIDIPTNYPFQAPVLRVRSVNDSSQALSEGRLKMLFNTCLENLRYKLWAPTLTIKDVLCSLSGVLANPGTDDPLVAKIAPVLAHVPLMRFPISRTCITKWIIAEAVLALQAEDITCLQCAHWQVFDAVSEWYWSTRNTRRALRWQMPF
mmetsp:Transcript_96169/g.222947  ORF Transcript_96169/g.222947 Transcript_96169/m.222947 type:complete len:203 (-) Transcript_96169:153-761(-)